MLKPIKMVFGIVLLMSFVGPVFAQTVDTAWVRTYNGPTDGSDRASSISIDNSGNVYLTGFSRGSGTSDDIATIKYHPNGDTAWVRRYNGAGNSYDYGADIVVDDSGYVYVTGYSWGDETQSDYTTIKYHPNGDTVWVRRYNGPGNSYDQGEAIALDDSNNVYITGESYGNGTQLDYATIKYRSNGDTAWVRRYNGAGNLEDVAFAIAVDDSGYVYVTGRTYTPETGNDWLTIKYHPNGDTAWVRRYDGPANSLDYANAIAVDGGYNVYVSGYSYDSETSDDYTIVKYHPNGDTAWVRRYNGPGSGSDNAFAMALDNSGNVYVTGSSYGTSGNEDYLTVKYDSDGDTAWARVYAGPGNDRDAARATIVDDSGNVYVTGESYANETSYDYAIIKYAHNGDTIWAKRYNGSGNSYDWSTAIVVDSLGTVYVTGSSVSIGTSDDYCTIKYVQKSSDVRDDAETRERPSKFALSQNYPNPFNPATAIRFKVEGQRLKVPVPTTLKIYNVLGEEVRTLVNEKKLPGDYTVQWDGKNDEGEQLASGVYFYELKVGDYTSTKKMVLLK